MYNLRNFHIFQTENPCSLEYGLDAIPYYASQPWQQVPVDIREADSLALFTKIAFRLGNVQCPCRSCKILFKMLSIAD